jgi:hypothetical protein
MSGNLPPDQGRARGLYDEQLQRLQQEKRLHSGRADAGPTPRPLFFARPDDERA